MNDALTTIPSAQRRRMALMLAPVGVVLLVAGVLVASLDGVGWIVAGLLVAVLAVALLAVAWGLWRSVALSEAAAAERQLDEVLAAAARSQGAACGGVGPEGSSTSSEGATCGSTGLVCGSSSGPGGCGAACLTRANSPAGRSNAAH
ncbi:MAG TPA: hypothetical protein VF612_00530 [Jatrophihabitans sp.]|uniref:hypothetical protein n=1 Tax=Jatrophihabitans sp. TaxID=1932789 RepID=UPI002EEF3AE0